MISEFQKYIYILRCYITLLIVIQYSVKRSALCITKNMYSVLDYSGNFKITKILWNKYYFILIMMSFYTKFHLHSLFIKFKIYIFFSILLIQNKATKIILLNFGVMSVFSLSTIFNLYLYNGPSILRPHKILNYLKKIWF